MGKHVKRIFLDFKGKSLLVLVLSALVFIASIGVLFSQEKRKLDTEFEHIISNSLKTHIQHNADSINRSITDAERALKTAKTLLMESGLDKNIRERLDRRNANAPDYPTEYLSMEEMASGFPCG